MPDHELEDRLGALGTTPVGALPGAAAARARGDRRTRRTRAGLAGGTAVVVLGAALGVGALGLGAPGGSQPDRVVPPARGPSASPTPSAASGWDAASGLLTTADASTVEPGAWAATALADGTAVLDPCGPRPGIAPAGSAGTSLFVEREAGGTSVSTQVLRYASAEDAAAALDDTRTALGSCASEPGGSDLPGSTRSYEVVTDSTDELLVRVVTSCSECLPDIAYAAVAQVGDGLVVLSVSVGEDGGPSPELVQSYASVAKQRLAQVAGAR